jgi:hypothetical protein
MVFHATGSRAGATVAVVMLALNPNLLYLQATPMTEPLLLALMLAGLASTIAWLRRGTALTRRSAGVLLALACMTRYEAWPVTATAAVLSALVLWRQGLPGGAAISRGLWVAFPSAVAIGWFMLHSRLTIGRWFVDRSFYVAENPALGDLVESTVQVSWGLVRLSGYVSTVLAMLAAAGLIAVVCLRRAQSPALLALAPVAAAALPWLAFLQGHPFRIRYMVPLVAASAIVAGTGVGLLHRRVRHWVAAVLLGLWIVFEFRPLDRDAPMVVEAQWDTKYRLGRREVTAYLATAYRGDKILASMGSLAHYMQETASAGLSLRDYIHEGNGDLWRGALAYPSAFVGWILVEERAEGGDMLAARGRRDPGFFDGFTRVAQGGGVALYRRHAAVADPRQNTR